jgi:hypothetical protein
VNMASPRSNYWAALLWRKLLQTTVLDAGAPDARGLHLYAHCLAEVLEEWRYW